MTMANSNRTDDRTTKWLRWTARGLGSLVAVLWVLIGIAEVAFPHTPPSPEASLQGAILAGLGTTTVLGVLIAWWRERIGGTIVVIGAIALSTFGYITAGRNKVWVMLFTGGPFLVAGILFLASWRRSQQADDANDDGERMLGARDTLP
jgi:hypothetical protein